MIGKILEKVTNIAKHALNAHTSVLWQLETSTPSISSYASLPFLPQKPPAWYMSNQRLFRIKRIVEWLDDGEVPAVNPFSDGLFYDKNA